ncbi:hypothetical protein PENSTE_c021G09850 [Penicillium steckii]|uniref:Uncharacterized protein n=1 Tax=Penicillium steckii TaxID=303698 RepID=A0A1V6STV6_9EURO|nr:hypothetical protein PENSTE_c021G09850 [Penicillium steckii]
MATLNTGQERAPVCPHQQYLSRLTPYGLYIVLWANDRPPQKYRFHWGLYFHTSPTQGLKYHIVNDDEDAWKAAHGETRGVFKSLQLCALVHIATIQPDARDDVDHIIKSLDGELNEYPGITCRVWVMMIVQLLACRRFLYCPLADDLEYECMEIGNCCQIDVITGRQPRSVIKSQVCFSNDRLLQ